MDDDMQDINDTLFMYQYRGEYFTIKLFLIAKGNNATIIKNSVSKLINLITFNFRDEK
jgi:hypothetical protein